VYEAITVKDLIEVIDSQASWDKRTAYADSIPASFIRSNGKELISHYHSLSPKDKINGVRARERLPTNNGIIKDWDAWSSNIHCIGYIFPTETTLLYTRLFRKAGYEIWSNWLDCFQRDDEIMAILAFDKDLSGEIINLFDEECSHINSTRILRFLFYHIILSEDTDPKVFLEVVYRHKDHLRQFAAEVLSDFFFQTRFSKQMNIYTGLKEMFSDSITVKVISGMTVSKGTLFAWSALLCNSDNLDDDLYVEFRKTYVDWVKSEPTYDFVTPTAILKSSEWDFLNSLCALIYDDKATIEQLQLLWMKKAEKYYGWQKCSVHSQWSIHIGLLLLGVGKMRYDVLEDKSVLVYVIETLNEYIPAALSEQAYHYLLSEIFSLKFLNSLNATNSLMLLVSKIYSIEIADTLIECCSSILLQEDPIFCELQCRRSILGEFYGQ